MSIEEFDQDAQGGAEGAGAAESYDADAGDSAFVVAEAKKPIGRGTVAMFVIVVCAVGTLYFLHQRAGVSSAHAADPKATQVIKQFMSDKEKNFSLMQKMIKDTESVVNQFLNYPSLKQVPLAELQTNPFRMQPEKADENPNGAAAEKRRRDEEARREAERQAVLKAAQGLTLQSVVTSGVRKACMIDNTLYTEGQVIESGGATFTIEQIAPDRVVVKSGAYRFALTMQK